MTTLATPQQIWNTMPGWGIVADLTLVVGYGYARWQAHTAAGSLADANLRTVQLRAEQTKYGAVTRVQGSIDGEELVISKLMSSDVDMAQLLGALRKPLPATMTVNSVSLSISQAGAAGAAAAAKSGNSLDTSGHQVVGKLQLEGNSHSLDDLAAYVISLQQVTGVVDVLPGNNTVSGGTVAWSLTCSVNDQLISHYFDKGKAASK
jgi:hypothetical protein